MGLMKTLFNKDTLSLYDSYLDDTVEYMTKYTWKFPQWRWLGRFAGGSIRLHHFHQGEPETDAFHDHEYHFYTFPFTSYREGILEDGHVRYNTVRAGRVTYREATMRHVVYGVWHDAGKYDEGVINAYKSFWTLVLGCRPHRNFSITRFVHPGSLTYDGFIAAQPEGDPRPYWVECEFDHLNQVETGRTRPIYPGYHRTRLETGKPDGADAPFTSEPAPPDSLLHSNNPRHGEWNDAITPLPSFVPFDSDTTFFDESNRSHSLLSDGQGNILMRTIRARQPDGSIMEETRYRDGSVTRSIHQELRS